MNRYAIIDKNGIVENIVSIYGWNESRIQAVVVGSAPVTVGDAYKDGEFTRGGAPVIDPTQDMAKKFQDLLEYYNAMKETLEA